MSVVLTKEYNFMVNSEEIIRKTEYLFVLMRCHINCCHYNCVQLFL